MEKNSQTSNSTGFNWGKGIALVIVLFVVATLSVVGFILGLDYHMVTENHYEKAENYQQHIERLEQTGTLEKPVEIFYSRQNELIQIRFPDSFSANELKGTVELYRPNDSSKDQLLELRINTSGIQNISGKNLHQGKWIVKVSWSSGSQNYYLQESIFI
jgi:nitrogen fixation protein FixH